MNKPTIKIFISSPGDVIYERQIAKRIIAKLGKEFAASARLEALLWEDMPLEVTTSFQKGIDQLANANLVDIAIFILWSRLGTPLGENYVKPDGSPYKSGTEYEFEMMYVANQQSGAPSILAYIKSAPITDAIFHSSARQDFDFEEIGKQQKEAQRFIREKFYDPETKTVYGAYHQFEAPTTFEQKLTEHLRRLIVRKIGHDAVQIEWEGNPYVGLRSFRYDENAIFYGRRHTINTIEEKFARWLPNHAPCLFVLGESGSGKSSLVRAGLLPDMIEFGWVENTKWKWFDISPSQFRGNIHNGLLSKLGEAFPVLNETAIGKDLMMGRDVNFGHLSDILPGKTQEAVLFFIDQFEEIFTDPLITEEERIRTFVLLKGMASTHKIWMIFSMRNDFYHKFVSYPVLSELKNESIIYDLSKILHSELQEIIEEPAKKAGLKWETNEKGMSLNRVIIHDINAGVDDLPLIEFALSELYNLRNENNVLTYKAYEDIGKIDGAVVKYVDNFYQTLSEKEKELFDQILSALIAPSLENKNLYVRKTALLKDLQKTELHRKLLSNLINSHILISGKDENDEATVSIVHEILISSWQVIQEWIWQEKELIEANNHYENLSKYWMEHGKSKNDLLQDGEAIKKSEYFLYSWENSISTNVKTFLFTSVKRKRRAFLPWVLLSLLIAGIVGVVWIFKYFLNNEKTDIDNFLTYCLITGLLVYVVWKKIKAVPRFHTVNVSLFFWSAFFISSMMFHLIWDWSNIWVLCLLLLPKLVLTIIEKREILQWKQRIFKKGFNFLSVFMDHSSKLLHKLLRTTVWVISVLLILCLGLGIPYLIYLQEDSEKIIKAQKEIEELFTRLDNLSLPLSANDRIFINKKRVSYLQGMYHGEETIFNSVSHGGWSSEDKYYEYAFSQYRLGYPEESLVGIQEYLQSNTMQYKPNTTIKSAFELGMFDDCRTLLENYKKTLENGKDHSINEFHVETIWVAEKVGLFELAKEMCEHLEKTDDNAALLIYKAHALLMTGEREQALSLYRRKINDYKNAIQQDFAVFRWLGFTDTEISAIEKELHLNKFTIYTLPADDANTDIAQSFIGKWQHEENGTRIQWEIKENDNLCRYLFQKLRNDKDEWIDEDIAVTRYRFKQIDRKTIIEEYNLRTNVLSVSEIVVISDNELQVTEMDNGNGKSENKIRVYQR